MPENDDDFDAEPFGVPGEDDQFKEMRRAANKAKKLEKDLTARDQRIADLERRVAFSDAGLTLSDKQKAALLAAHDGEMSRDALRATAAELGFIQADEPDGEAAQREAALRGQASIASASAGAPAPAPLPELPQRIADAERAGDLKLAMQLKAQQVATQARLGQAVQIS